MIDIDDFYESDDQHIKVAFQKISENSQIKIFGSFVFDKEMYINLSVNERINIILKKLKELVNE
ncbi:hypothetical protein [Leuconostoc fallax]|uniref:hypothetical protein n=1 Tax=Leuconostoc fallax TaxID=1251 RepID=UPI001C1F05AE|nr:hypothetical protein [Leuconostoc fallax]MBU7455836.1 hypothetical protein [Leuconostoc fallax]